MDGMIWMRGQKEDGVKQEKSFKGMWSTSNTLAEWMMKYEKQVFIDLQLCVISELPVSDDVRGDWRMDLSL